MAPAPSYHLLPYGPPGSHGSVWQVKVDFAVPGTRARLRKNPRNWLVDRSGRQAPRKFSEAELDQGMYAPAKDVQPKVQMSNGEWVNKDVRIPEGAYLASSHETPGAERALLFEHETGNNLGPAELRDPKPLSDSDDSDSLLRDALAVVIGAALTFVAVKGPDMKRGLDEKAIPAIKAKWSAFKTRWSDKRTAHAEGESSDSETRPHLALVKNEADPGFAAPAA